MRLPTATAAYEVVLKAIIILAALALCWGFLSVMLWMTDGVVNVGGGVPLP